MGQINVYFPEDLEEAIRKKAKDEKKSLSEVVIEITKKDLTPETFPSAFWKLAGCFKNEKIECERPTSDELEENDLNGAFDKK